ncbi:MAG: acetate/propionate family kinase [Planctomycetota bacterium]
MMKRDRSPFILVLNPGSSTLKHASYRGTECIGEGTVECGEADNSAAIGRLLSGSQWSAVAFRVVHGGNALTAPTRVTDSVIETLEKTIPLAPLHQPPALSAIRTVGALLPGIPRIACFDTAFHATLPEQEQRFAIADRYFQMGIRRYGFHGLSYESIASQLPGISEQAARRKTIVCHLGNGASLCGMDACVSRYTSMGLTPIDGLIMGTRCGRIDVGVAIHWLREGMTAQRIETIVTKESGLAAVSEGTSDMRTLVERAPHDPRCELAIEMFCRSVAKEVSAAATAIGGLDCLVFTAGIGENSSLVRQRVVALLAWLGGEIDADANQRRATRLNTASSRFEILCIPTNEQEVIARHAIRLLEDRLHEDIELGNP